MAETVDRIVSPVRNVEDFKELTLRPRHLDEMIGQDRVRENLAILIQAAKQRNEALDHVIFYSPPGLGKTTLAHILSNEMEANLKITSGPAIERAGDLAAIVTNLQAGDFLFIDEIHRLGRAVEEILYPAMEDFALDITIGKGPSARAIRLQLSPFTVVGATTRLALVTSPLRARFGATFRLDFYDQKSMEAIIRRAAGLLGVDTDEGGIVEIACRARGTPRVALRLLRRVRDFAQVRADGKITEAVTSDALELLEIDELGLDNSDRRVLHAIIKKFSGGPVGLQTISASINEEPETIMEVVEPYLLQLGFIDRTPKGRIATALAYEHLGLKPPSQSQARLPEM
ncbi:MAG: Holliday junction branch migration DNA helicase RuvB [Anaerolineales bacterium]|nr:Holliday junction branch migration DNA helicase RuvB [Anaerolineales bacterium]